MSERIRTFLAVAVLTVAIWVWADLEQTGEIEVRVPVQVVAPQDVQVRSFAPKQLLVTLRGPKGELQALSADPDDLACRFHLAGADGRASPLTLDARDGFRHLAGRRVLVTDTKDEHGGAFDGRIFVNVDRLVEVRGVRVEVQVTGAVASQAVARPAEVSARVAASDLAALPRARHFVVAALAVETLPEDLKAEEEVTLERRLGGQDGVDATFDPPIVRVTALLKSAVTTKILGRFPILVSAPPEVLNRYRIVFQPEAERWVILEIKGPGPAVERLKPQDLRVQLVLTEDDKPAPGSWLPGKPVVVGLPAGVELAKPLPTVNFNLERYDETPAPTP